MKILEKIWQLLFPPKCVLCRKVLDKNETDLCHACRAHNPDCSQSNRKLPFVDHFAGVWYYEGEVRRSILRYKFYGARGYAKIYGGFLAMAIQKQEWAEFDVLTWVPTGFWRKLRRGYDQVELLATAVGAELGAEPVKLLRKIRHNKPQSGIMA